MDLEETEASNDYDGEGQQQFNLPTETPAIQKQSIDRYQKAIQSHVRRLGRKLHPISQTRDNPQVRQL
jgi:hypothetical protein